MAFRGIRLRIERMPIGRPFTTAEFYSDGTRATIDQALSRLSRTGYITRLARGIYARPPAVTSTARWPPSTIDIARAVARATGSVVQLASSEAAERLGLARLAPARSPSVVTYLTSGPSRNIRYGDKTIRLVRTHPRKLLLLDRPAGWALTMLYCLGHSRATEQTIAAVRKALSAEEFEALLSISTSMPAWMADLLKSARYEPSPGPGSEHENQRMQRVATVHKLDDPTARHRDLAHWLSRPPAERIAAVEFLRRQQYGSTKRLQRIVRIAQQAQG